MSNEKSVAYREGAIAANAGKELSFSNPYVLDSDPYLDFVDGFNSVEPVVAKLVSDEQPVKLAAEGAESLGGLESGLTVGEVFDGVKENG